MAEKPITVDDVRKALREGLKLDVPGQTTKEDSEIVPVVTVDDVRLFLKGNPPEPVKPPVRSNGDPDAKPTMNPKAKPTHTGKKARNGR